MQISPIWVIGALLLGYATVVGALVVYQRRLIFHPDTEKPDAYFAKLPAGAPLDILTYDGISLHSWYQGPGGPTMPVVLYLHGNYGHIGYRAARLATFDRLGWGVLLLGYRGYGGNDGTPSERGLLMDGRAGLQSLMRMGIAPGRIVLWGESLGSGLAVQLAAETAVGATVLEAPYTSLVALAKQKLPCIPIGLLLHDHFDSMARIASVHTPLFVLGGGRDTLVPLAMSRMLFEAANEPKELFVQLDAGHNDLGTPAAFTALSTFIARYIGVLAAPTSPSPSP